MACGQQDQHCCWLGVHGECQYVHKVDREDRVWVCSLRDELGSWEEVHSDPRYLENVKPKLIECAVEQDCGDWPPPEGWCATCGKGDNPNEGIC